MEMMTAARTAGWWAAAKAHSSVEETVAQLAASKVVRKVVMTVVTRAASLGGMTADSRVDWMVGW